MMKTGTDVVTGGVYASDCCFAETGLTKDAMFPRCPKCLRLTLWNFISPSPAPEVEEAA
jgi:hypothetical protein